MTDPNTQSAVAREVARMREAASDWRRPELAQVEGPNDLKIYGGTIADDIDRWADMLSAHPPADTGEAVAWACKTCNSPRKSDPCWKCGSALRKPADGWEWPGLPDVDRIRALAKEVGYAIGVHGSLERDLDLIAAPWVEDAVEPLALAEHIAAGLGGRVVDHETQDKPCGRWSCNIHTPDWTKMIDLSVMPAAPVAGRGDLAVAIKALERVRDNACGVGLAKAQGMLQLIEAIAAEALRTLTEKGSADA